MPGRVTVGIRCRRVGGGALRARGIRMLDDLVLSHVHMDHVGGTRAVLNAVAVGRSHAS